MEKEGLQSVLKFLEVMKLQVVTNRHQQITKYI